jgi:hypothetical protein
MILGLPIDSEKVRQVHRRASRLMIKENNESPISRRSSLIILQNDYPRDFADEESFHSVLSQRRIL